jgi:hypothetical protein
VLKRRARSARLMVAQVRAVRGHAWPVTQRRARPGPSLCCQTRSSPGQQKVSSWTGCARSVKRPGEVSTGSSEASSSLTDGHSYWQLP